MCGSLPCHQHPTPPSISHYPGSMLLLVWWVHTPDYILHLRKCLVLFSSIIPTGFKLHTVQTHNHNFEFILNCLMIKEVCWHSKSFLFLPHLSWSSVCAGTKDQSIRFGWLLKCLSKVGTCLDHPTAPNKSFSFD